MDVKAEELPSFLVHTISSIQVSSRTVLLATAFFFADV